MLRFELNKLRRGCGNPRNKQGTPSYAAVSLLVGHHDAADSRKFAVFCIARLGAQIYDMALVNPVDRHLIDVSFGDCLLFSRMPPYFELEDNNKYNIPRKLAKYFGRAVGRTIAKSLEDNKEINEAAPEREVKGPKFSLIPKATLWLEDAGDDVSSHELYLEDTENERTPNLFGHFCCRLVVQPDCREKVVLVGGLSVSVWDQTNQI